MNPKIFQRYIGREIQQASLYVLIAFLAIFLFFDLIAEIDEVTRGIYRIDEAFLYVVLGLASRIVEILPVAVLIGTLWALARSAQHSEFTVFRVSGLRPKNAITTFLSIGFPIVMITAIFSEILAPAAEGYRMQMSERGVAHGQINSGLWLRDTVVRDDPRDEQVRFVNASRVLPDKTLKGVTIYELNSAQRLVRVIEASAGQYLNQSGSTFQWQLKSVRVTRFAADGAISTDSREAFVLQSSLAPWTLTSLMTQPDRMSSLELYRYIQYLKQNKQQSERYVTSFWKRLVYPCVIWVMMLLALPAAFLQARSGAVGTRVFAGILIGVAFHLLNSLFSHLGVLTTWPAPLMALFPSIMALGLAGFFLYWVQYR